MVRKPKVCAVCTKVIVGTRRQRYCSVGCRQKAFYQRQVESVALGKQQGGANGHPETKSYLGIPTEPSLLFFYPRFARTNDAGKVLCAGCGEPMKQEPVVLAFPEPEKGQYAVPVYHAECYAS